MGLMEEYKELNGIQKTIVTASVFAVLGLIFAGVYVCFYLMFNLSVLAGFVCLCILILFVSFVAAAPAFGD